MEIYITKWALTKKGILKIQIEGQIGLPSFDFNNTIFGPWDNSKEYFQSEDEALKRAEEKRIEEIRRLRKKISQLEALQITKSSIKEIIGSFK